MQIPIERAVRSAPLSAGTRRKVWLAGAFASGAAVTLLDEPFAALDLPTTVSLFTTSLRLLLMDLLVVVEALLNRENEFITSESQLFLMLKIL